MTTPLSAPASPSWYVVDAKSQTLGRLATRIAHVLRGKHRVSWVPYKPGGDHVVVINAGQIVLQGTKAEKKTYARHSGYFGNMKTTTAAVLLRSARPQEVLVRAVRGMLPRNRLRPRMMLCLHVYKDATHPHEAQKPAGLDTVFPPRRTPKTS